MPEQPVNERYYNWTRTCFVFIAVLMALILTKFLSVGPKNLWPLVPLIPLPFLFLVNLWLAFRRTHKSLLEMREAPSQGAQAMVEALFGLGLTAGCGLLIALVVGIMLGRSLGH